MPNVSVLIACNTTIIAAWWPSLKAYSAFGKNTGRDHVMLSKTAPHTWHQTRTPALLGGAHTCHAVTQNTWHNRHRRKSIA